MADTDLLFQHTPLVGSPVNLVFGEDSPPPEFPDAHVTGHIALGVTLSVGGGVRASVHAAGAISLGVSISVAGAARYFTDTSRPLVGKVATHYQDAGAQPMARTTGFQNADEAPHGFDARYQDAAKLLTGIKNQFQDATRLWKDTVGRYQDGAGLHNGARADYQDATRLRSGNVSRYQDADRLHNGSRDGYQDATRLRKGTAGRYQDAKRYSQAYWSGMRHGVPLWWADRVRYQDAMRPPPGIWIRPEPPGPDDRCYIPSPHLLFDAKWVADTNLLFWCERHEPPPPDPDPGEVVVPVKAVYLVVNSAVLIRVSDGKIIPTSAMSLALDVDSWTWSFSAAVPARAYDDVAWELGEPVEAQATVNGTDFRFLVETIGRDRTFQRDDLRIGGRGRAALLDSPYAPTLNLFSDTGRTSQQLVEWVLSDNGIPLGWTVDWNITPWFVPADVFAHQGSYMSGVTRIAESAGAYVQPHNTADTIIILPRYPVGPWEWGSVTPDFDLPSAVVQREGTEWAKKPYYNRVFVRGEDQGIVGQVTRLGSAGDMLAPEIVDPLITHVDAARQRGLSILSDVGRVTNLSLRMPVLSETGIIKPGKFVRYQDNGVNRIGITRSVQVDVTLPTIWQTIGIEHHEEPV